LVSFVEPANVYEGNLLCAMIRNTQKNLSLHIDIVAADMGYISSDHKKELRKQYQTAVITKVRENMFAAEEYRDHGCPECPEGMPLLWDGYDPETETHRYLVSMDHATCRLCRLQGFCYREVSISSQIDEHRFGVIPLHSTVAQRLLQRIRPQVERGFEKDKNKLSLNRFFANSLEMAKTLGHLADACQILLLFAEMKTNTKAKAKRVMKAAYTQLSLDL
jgi:hypothetical protein